MSARDTKERLTAKLNARVDSASVGLFRILFFGLMTLSSLRFIAEGWVERCFVQPSFFFHYWGASSVQVLSPGAMMGLHVVMAASAALACLGLFYRLAAPIFLLSFVYAELCDATNYLNHYYQAALLTLLFCLLPAHGVFSLDARMRPALHRATLPAWNVYLLRFQVGVVYVFAGLAKAQPDWLLHGQPLGIWLAARTELPLLGPLFGLPGMHLVMSWAGFLFDSTIVFWLLRRRTRPYAYAVVIVFHALTHLLFHIGVFPFLMTLSALIFFEPDWPRQLARRLRTRRQGSDESASQALQASEPSETPPAGSLSPWLAGALAAYVFIQLAMPLRTHLYGGNVLWHEQGMRFSWRVMVRSKTGSVTYRVRARGLVNEQHVEPCRYLNALQEREMAGQPDMILQLAQRIAADYRERGFEEVQVRVDAFASLNGRRRARLIDPNVDLSQIRDGLLPASYILPAPETPPLHAPSPLASAAL